MEQFNFFGGLPSSSEFHGNPLASGRTASTLSPAPQSGGFQLTQGQRVFAGSTLAALQSGLEFAQAVERSRSYGRQARNIVQQQVQLRRAGTEQRELMNIAAMRQRAATRAGAGAAGVSQSSAADARFRSIEDLNRSVFSQKQAEDARFAALERQRRRLRKAKRSALTFGGINAGIGILSIGLAPFTGGASLVAGGLVSSGINASQNG